MKYDVFLNGHDVFCWKSNDISMFCDVFDRRPEAQKVKKLSYFIRFVRLRSTDVTKKDSTTGRSFQLRPTLCSSHKAIPSPRNTEEEEKGKK